MTARQAVPLAMHALFAPALKAGMSLSPLVVVSVALPGSGKPIGADDNRIGKPNVTRGRGCREGPMVAPVPAMAELFAPSGDSEDVFRFLEWLALVRYGERRWGGAVSPPCWRFADGLADTYPKLFHHGRNGPLVRVRDRRRRGGRSACVYDGLPAWGHLWSMDLLHRMWVSAVGGTKAADRLLAENPVLPKPHRIVSVVPPVDINYFL